mmetsp:Transcript_89897/g.187931  ORF Transcript_89897/g.187931 Transcript_89897/m.187931 type:complete len:232 (-) Transcript_89897:653-1348(-)
MLLPLLLLLGLWLRVLVVLLQLPLLWLILRVAQLYWLGWCNNWLGCLPTEPCGGKQRKGQLLLTVHERDLGIRVRGGEQLVQFFLRAAASADQLSDFLVLQSKSPLKVLQISFLRLQKHSQTSPLGQQIRPLHCCFRISCHRDATAVVPKHSCGQSKVGTPNKVHHARSPDLLGLRQRDSEPVLKDSQQPTSIPEGAQAFAHSAPWTRYPPSSVREQVAERPGSSLLEVVL